MSVEVYLNANSAAEHHVDTHKAVVKENEKISIKATKNLEATEHTPRITGVNDPADVYFPAEILVEYHDVDAYTILHAPNAVALEFGHRPSGYFKNTDTQPPLGEYILTRAAYG